MLLEVENYNNLLNDVNITSNDVLQQIISYPLEFDSYKNKEVEWGTKLPMFLDSFYPYIKSNNRVPTQLEFWEQYRGSLPTAILDRGDAFLRGIKARLYRTYPSLVRDIHFSLLLSENSSNSSIIYNRDLDVECGIDILVVFREKYYALNLFTPTKRAFVGRHKKSKRHHKYENIIDIELPVTFNNSHKHGEFFLYGTQEMAELRTKFKSLINE